jgi:hypothetical protein
VGSLRTEKNIAAKPERQALKAMEKLALAQDDDEKEDTEEGGVMLKDQLENYAEKDKTKIGTAEAEEDKVEKV